MKDTERMTREEIERRYPDQYVVVVAPEWRDPRSDEFTSARVVAVGQAWDEAIERARPLLAAGDRWVCGFVGDRQIVLQPLGPLAFGYVTGYALECRTLDRDAIRQALDLDRRQRLTWPQIRERYPDRWVVMADHDSQEDDLLAWKTARVLADAATRGEAVGRARAALQGCAFYGCRHTGTIRGPLAQLRQLGIEP